LYAVKVFAATGNLWIDAGVGTLLLAVFVVYVVRHDLPLRDIPILNRLVRK
ncbi:MAG TPA: lipopolysaccharide biosynthesis protein, partial [Candidatus Avibacteroides faecavium]|nr:lipopolysaccharide biosynthesis protein [Candidatus Avibacteroides faecavium]